jgi:hypothetical protein
MALADIVIKDEESSSIVAIIEQEFTPAGTVSG